MTTAARRGTSLRRRAVLAMAVSAIGLAGMARAQPRSADLVGLAVVDRETGAPIRVWRQGGRLFVAGQPGARYSLRVSNHTGERVLVVMSVDGVNVMSGETAGFDQRGYVFDPYQSYDVSGWRKSDTEVAAFTFAPLPQSYAARTGRPVDVGVIGIAAFREREEVARERAEADAALDEIVVTGSRVAPSPAAPPRAAKAAPSARVAAPEQRTEKLGTGHGAREWSAIVTVAFERATSYPQQIRRIEYDTYDNLVAAGVIHRPPVPNRPPQPFPANGYVPDPPGRP